MSRLEDIRAFAFDVDGVFTDGLVLAMPDGELLRQFNSKDCFAIRTACDKGYPCAIITGGCSESLIRRAVSLGIPNRDIFFLSKDKASDLEFFCARHSLTLGQVAFMGDDLPDIPAIEAAGLGVAPSDAVAEVRAAADMVSTYGGGRGCVRDLVEQVMKAQGTWGFNPEKPWNSGHPEEITRFAKLTGRNVE